MQTAEGELQIQIPQVRGCTEKFVPRVIPDTRTIIRTRPLEALVIGAYVRGLSDRDIESLAREAGQRGSARPPEVRSLDAVHLAAARLPDADLDELITYDDRMRQAAIAQGLSVSTAFAIRLPRSARLVNR